MDYAYIAFAFVMGFAIHNGTICLVLAAQEWVNTKQKSRLIEFVQPSCWAGLAASVVVFLAPADFARSDWYAVNLSGLAAGALFGVSAAVNEGCTFGTLARFSNGNFNYLDSFIGVVCAGFCVPNLPFAPVPRENPLATSEAAPVLFIAGFGIICLILAVRMIGLWRLIGARSVTPASCHFIEPVFQGHRGYL